MRKIIFGFLILLVGCTNNSGTSLDEQYIKVISDDNNTEKLHVNNDISFVQLETSEDCLIGNVINVEITNQYIYVLDRKSFFIFSKDGRFVKKIKRGKGPGELTRALNFSVDENRKEIYIIEMGNILHIYNDLAVYKETYKLDGSFIDVIRLNDDNFMLYTVLPHKHEDFLISVYNINSKTIISKYIPYENLAMKDFSILTYNNFFVINDEIYFSASNSRNIYKYAEDSMQTIYSIDFDDLNPSVSYLNKFNNVREFMKMVYIDNYIGFINFSFYFDEFMLVGFKYKDYNCGISYKDENKMYISSVSDLFDLPKTPSFERPYNANGNQIYFVYYNDLLLIDNIQKEEMILEIGDQSIKLTENSNPIIVTVTIK